MRFVDRIRRAFQRAQLSPAARRLVDQGMTYLKPAKLLRIERSLAKVGQGRVPGDYLEFGVALGGTSALIAPAAKRTGARFLGFDVFGMIPPPESEHDDAKSQDRYADIVEGKAKGIADATYYGYRTDLIDHVAALLGREGAPVDDDRVRLVPGLFEDSWPTVADGVTAIAFAHIDCDWHDPVRYCLEAVAPRLSPGGIVMIDDYHDYEGCRVAVDRFLADHPDFVMDAGANPLICRRA